MNDISSKIDRAKELATLHVKLSKAATTATEKRDACLYEWLEAVHDIKSALLKLSSKKMSDVLKAKYGMVAPKKLSGLMQRIYPELPVKRRSKYKLLLRLRKNKAQWRKLGGINKGVRAVKELRDGRKTSRKRKGK